MRQPTAAARASVGDRVVQLRDSLVNLVTGLGTTKDKTLGTTFSLVPLSDQQLEAAFRGDWVARKVVSLPAADATREWRTWSADDKDLSALEAEEQRLDVQRKVKKALTWSRLYGGAALILGDGASDPTLPLVPELVQRGGLKYLHVLNRKQLAIPELDRDVNSDTFGLPKWYDLTGAGTTQLRLHPSRVIRFVGQPYPDPTTAPDSWGDSVLMAVNDAVQQVGITGASIAQMVSEAKVDVFQIPDFMANIGTQEYRNRLVERFQLANVSKSTINALLLDKEETWERKETNFSTLPDILKLYLLIASGAADIPVTRMLGQSPAGLNATGESDIRNYYDHISDEQRNVVGPTLKQLDDVLVRSALGDYPDDGSVYFNWEPLWQLSDSERADIAVKHATAFTADVTAGLMDPATLSEARESQLVDDGTYPGLASLLADAESPLNETDPNVAGQFSGGSEVQQQALNGIQISSMQAIAEAVSGGQLPPESAKAIMAASFPLLTPEQVDQIIDPMVGFEPPPTTPPPQLQLAGPPNPSPPPGVTSDEDLADWYAYRTSRKNLRNPKGRFVRRKGMAFSPNPPPTREPVAVDATDATPRSLYVYRPLLNAQDIIAWAKAQGFTTTLPATEMHVTICYSRDAVDWMKVDGSSWGEDEDGNLRVKAGGPRIVEKLGAAAVLLFGSSALSYRHVSITSSTGASWDFPDFQPHVTISYEPPPGLVLPQVEPYTGELLFGPEVFEEVDDDWQNNVDET